jgi:hypothetical protein
MWCAGNHVMDTASSELRRRLLRDPQMPPDRVLQRS